MSNDFDDFVFVTHKKKSKRIPKIVQPTEATTSQESCFNRESCIRRIEEAKEDILASNFYESIRASLREGLQLLNGPKISGIVCFGLGKFTECMTSRYQLALLLTLRDLFSNHVSAYDPAFTMNEHDILTHFDINLIKKNTEGKYNPQLEFNKRKNDECDRLLENKEHNKYKNEEQNNDKCDRLLENLEHNKYKNEEQNNDKCDRLLENLEHNKYKNEDDFVITEKCNKNCNDRNLIGSRSSENDFDNSKDLIDKKHYVEPGDFIYKTSDKKQIIEQCKSCNSEKIEVSNCNHNNEGFEPNKHNVETTIFFLPHCPKQLSNNLLWANWGFNLNKCIIIANSFNRILETNTRRAITNSAEYLLKISPYVKELAVINSFRFYDIFNDTAIHVFPKESLALLAKDFWEDNEEPIYEIEDVEFVRK